MDGWIDVIDIEHVAHGWDAPSTSAEVLEVRDRFNRAMRKWSEPRRSMPSEQLQLPGKRNAEEILGRQLDTIRSMDVTAVIGADRFVGQNVIDAIRAANENLPPDDDTDPFLDDQEPGTNDLYAEFE